MIKTIRINDKSFTLASSGRVLIEYKQQFGVEYYDDLLRIKAIELNVSATELQKAAITLEVGYRLVWSMAKAASPSEIPDPDVWMDSFTEFPLVELLPQAMELLGKAFEQAVADGGGGSGRLTSENLAACCLACGMSMEDISSLSIGFLLNSITEYIKIKNGGKSPSGTKRKATQADFDAF